MSDVGEAIRESKWYRPARAALGVFSVVCGVLGLASLGADIETWGKWIDGLDSWVPYVAIYGSSLAVGVALLFTEARHRRKTVRGEAGDRAPAPQTPPRPQRHELAAPAQTRRTPQEPRAPRAPARRALVERLQTLLDEGVKLRRETQPTFMAGVAGLRAHTTDADFDTWLKRTQRVLRDADPELLAEFNYRPRKAPFDALLRMNDGMPRFKADLERRIANLRGIISDLQVGTAFSEERSLPLGGNDSGRGDEPTSWRPVAEGEAGYFSVNSAHLEGALRNSGQTNAVVTGAWVELDGRRATARTRCDGPNGSGGWASRVDVPAGAALRIEVSRDDLDLRADARPSLQVETEVANTRRSARFELLRQNSSASGNWQWRLREQQ